MAVYQVGDQLKEDDNRVKGINKAYQNIAVDRMKSRFFEIYSSAYFLPSDDKNKQKGKGLARGSKAPPKQLTGTGTRTGTRTGIGNSDSRFSEFWSAYPKKVGKDAALKQFDARKVDDELQSQILAAIAIQKQSPGWKKDGGQFIPNPATWLSQGRWQDEVGTTAQDDPYGLRTAL